MKHWRAIGARIVRCMLVAAIGAVPLAAPAATEPEVEVTRLEEGPAADRVLRERSQHLLQDPAAAMRAAHEALVAGDRAHAAWLLGEIMRRHAIVGDYAALELVEVLHQDHRSEEARDVALRALDAYRDSPVRPDLHMLLGEIEALKGREEGAFAAWRATLDETRDEEKRAATLLSIANLEERIGRDAEAATTYNLIWYDYPLTSEAQVAGHRLDVLEAFLGQSPRDARSWRRRGDRLFRKRHNDAALEAYDRALALGLSQSETKRVQHQRAHTLFRQRRYPEAVEAFGSLPQRDDIPIWHARSQARAGDVPEAIRAFERIARSTRGAVATRARFLAALLLDGRDQQERAWDFYQRVARASNSGGMGDAAGWRLGWSAYRQGHYDEAIAYFDRLVRRGRHDRIGVLRPRYWRARALENKGDPRAAAEFREIATEFPLSYYGWRARDRVAPADLRADTPQPTGAEHALPAGRRKLRPGQIERARVLLEAGMHDEATHELRALGRRAGGLEERLQIAEMLTQAGAYHQAQQLAVIGHEEILARGPIPQQEDLWWFAWPSAYADMVDEATRAEGSVDPDLVYSIMREESGYRADVVSPVGARGLLQIMTTTGERLARDTGLPDFRPDDLFEPRTNIGLGSYYLSELSRRFGGHLAASIASYNAGPDAVSEWVLAKAHADDEWVEAIPYDQTRSYVKRVLRSLHAYRVLY